MKQSFLREVGLEFCSPKDFEEKTVTLRDGRNALLWVDRITGHGVLDRQYWTESEYYLEQYRNEHSSILGSKTDNVDNLRISKALNERQFNTFSELISPATRYLEVGCSFGGILNLVAALNPAEIRAVEPSEEDCSFVRRNCNKAEIINDSFENADLPENYFDIVVAIEVLEHTVSPLAFLKKCAALLNYNGVIHLEVPNLHDVLLSHYIDTSYERFFYHKGHIHYFTPASLEKLASLAGFEGRVSSFLMYRFFNHVHWAQNSMPQKSAEIALYDPAPARTDTDAGRAINDFYSSVSEQYEQLINKHMLGDCLLYQGRKKYVQL
ncbi:MAG: class I SAM-dependent methyltransferase [Victivallaceae bacterium]|nr:class I SAM-dependent methyltransferase [Victivallaceae bacterium]